MKSRPLWTRQLRSDSYLVLSPSQRLPLGIPRKTTESARGQWEEGKGGSLWRRISCFFSFPFPSPPSPPPPPARAFFFSLSSLLYDTKRPLRRREYLVAIYQFVGWMDRVKRLGLGWRLNSTPIFSLGTSLNWDGEHDTLAWNRNTNKSCFYQTRMTDVI